MLCRTAAVALLCLLLLNLGADDREPLVVLARAAVRAEVEGRDPPRPGGRSPARPVFVTIERKGQVLGCRGGLECRTRSLEDEVILAARAAAAHDPRHPPLTPQALAGCRVTVTVVDRLVPLDRLDALTPAEGLVLKSGNRTGVVLPWEGKDPATRLDWAYRKAGVERGAPVALFLMIAERTSG